MASELEIWNAALALLGEEVFLSDPDADPAPRQQRVAKALLPPVRDTLLRLHPWLCAERRMTLTPLAAGAGDWRYASAFILPVEALRVWSVESCQPYQVGPHVEYKTDGTVKSRRQAVFSDETQPLKVRLIERVAYQHLDPLLADAMAHELAARMAGPLQADKAMQRRLKEDAAAALARAVTAETSEFADDPPLATGRFLGAR